MVEEREPILLNLVSLIEGIPALTPALGGTLAEAAAVCFANQGHGESCLLQVQWEVEQRAFTLHRLLVSEPMLRAYRDMQEATELGACGVAILVVRDITGHTVVERSVKGTGFDYWLGTVHSSEAGLEPFERKARLEVSGILQGGAEIVAARVREKIRQTRRSAGDYPAYIVVVEFGTPMARMEQDE
jgi:hypothetical protein